MIPAADLRIGNKITGNTGIETIRSFQDNMLLDGKEVPFKSEKERIDHSHLIMVDENVNQYFPIEIHGILITEQWLTEKAGFARDSDKPIIYYCGKHFCYTFSHNLLHVWLSKEMVWLPDLKIDFVHEFQNVYKTLEGNDLLII